jgi:hypothetical protein
MKKIITFSGHSQRFLDEGFPIKPLIDIGKKKVYELAIKTVTGICSNESDLIFIVKETDCVNYNIDKIFKKQYPKASVCIIKDHRDGPVISILNIQDFIPDNEEIIVSYCDLYINWKFDEFIKHCRDTNSDGVIATHNNWHPHRVYNNYFCYLQVNENDVKELKEKQHFTDNPINEPASSGVYYFKTGYILKSYFNKLVNNNIKVNNEFYVTLPFNLMIEDKLNITHFSHRNYFCLGTPKDVRIIQNFLKLKADLSSSVIEAVKYFTEYSDID